MNQTIKKTIPSINWWKPVILIICIVTLFIVFNLSGSTENLINVQAWIKNLGAWGPVAFFFIYIGAIIATIPGTIFGILAGALFGSIAGVIIISISSTIGASITFLIARYFAREPISQWLSKNPKMKRFDQLTQTHGMIMVAFTRLIPLFPFTLLNYGFGLTKVPFKTYVFWSWLCMLPATILIVVGSDAIMQAIISRQISVELFVVLITSFIILILTGWYAKREYNKKTGK
ncbi:MAG: TVP38/TMEM64 family protein [Thermoplasmatota archaeon]